MKVYQLRAKVPNGTIPKGLILQVPSIGAYFPYPEDIKKAAEQAGYKANYTASSSWEII